MNDAEVEARYGAAARAALAAFPLDVLGVSPVTVSENVTFHVHGRLANTEVPDDFVLRLHRPAYHSPASLNSEHLWVRALGEAGIAVPRPLRTHSGDEFAHVHVAGDDEWRAAGLAHWQHGEILADALDEAHDAAQVEDWYRQLGELMAAMHAQACAWSPPPGFERHALDADGLMGDTPFWGAFWSHPTFTPAERTLMLATRDRLRAALLRLGKPADSYSLIHADLHQGNLVLADGKLHVIDFDDAGFGWHAYDIAVALLRVLPHRHGQRIADALVAGYRTRRSLPEDILALLPMFLLVRELALVGWVLQRPELARGLSRAEAAALCARCAAFAPPC
jgi:Ser/Thr protein kinase RdoA (MazF antagonist)